MRGPQQPAVLEPGRAGLENRLAEIVAEELDARIEYTWWAQRRGFFRNTLRAGLCDVVMGVPSSFELVAPTRPYYRSTYVFLYRADAPWEIDSFDDPDLRRLRVGVQVVGDDGANTPPVHALSNRGIVRNVVGYTVYVRMCWSAGVRTSSGCWTSMACRGWFDDTRFTDSVMAMPVSVT